MVQGQMPRASLVSSAISSELSKSWLCGKGYLHANKLYSFSCINCACLRGALAFCSEREKPQSHSLAYTSSHCNRRILNIPNCCGGTRKYTEFYHSIPACHRSPQLFENKARQHPPPNLWMCSTYIIPQNNLWWKLHFHMSATKTWAIELHTQGKSARNNSKVAFHGEMLSMSLAWVALIRDSASGIDLREGSWRMDAPFQRNNINKNTPTLHSPAQLQNYLRAQML